MEIFGTTSSARDASLDRPVSADKADQNSDKDADQSSDATSSSDTVEISPEAAQLAAKAKDGESDESGDEDSDSEKSEDDDGKPSVQKSFVYGALGLERPEESQKREADGYDWGRWLAAGVTIGSIISVLV